MYKSAFGALQADLLCVWGVQFRGETKVKTCHRLIVIARLLGALWLIPWFLFGEVDAPSGPRSEGLSVGDCARWPVL